MPPPGGYIATHDNRQDHSAEWLVERRKNDTRDHAATSLAGSVASHRARSVPRRHGRPLPWAELAARNTGITRLERGPRAARQRARDGSAIRGPGAAGAARHAPGDR